MNQFKDRLWQNLRDKTLNGKRVVRLRGHHGTLNIRAFRMDAGCLIFEDKNGKWEEWVLDFANLQAIDAAPIIGMKR